MHKCISWDILSPGRKWDILSPWDNLSPEKCQWNNGFSVGSSVGHFVAGEEMGHFVAGTICRMGRKWDILSSGTICRPKNAGGTICRWDKMSPNHSASIFAFAIVFVMLISQTCAQLCQLIYFPFCCSSVFNTAPVSLAIILIFINWSSFSLLSPLLSAAPVIIIIMIGKEHQQLRSIFYLYAVVLAKSRIARRLPNCLQVKDKQEMRPPDVGEE